MVSLAVAENCPSGPPDTTAESLRENALWFPDIPESHLQLNEIHFADHYNPGLEFEPLCYAIFRDATNQRALMKISVRWERHYIAKIDFHCSTGEVLSIGRVNEDVDAHYAKTKSFDIDGTGGEVIKEIKIGRLEQKDRLCGEPGQLNSIKVGAHLLG